MQRPVWAGKTTDRLLVVIFFAFVTLPLVGSFFGWDLYDVQENRRLAQPLDLRALAIEDIPDAFDEYYRDHFGFRNFLIRRWNRLQRRLDQRLLRQVLPGKGQWLFYDRPDVILDYLGRSETTDEDLEYWRRAIEGRQSWLAERGVRYLFGVAPSKLTVYPEMLPDDIRSQGGHTTRLDRLVEYMETHSEVSVLDLRTVLLARKGWRRLYMPTDTHWNFHGAYLGYRSVVERLRKMFPELEPPIELTDCRIETAPFYGDLAKLADLPRSEYTIELDTIYPPKREGFEKAAFQDPLFTPERIWPVDYQPPPVYRCPGGRYRAVIFHDSFFGMNNSLMAWHFRESTFIWHELDPDALIRVVERQQPDVVIEIIAERLLYRLPKQSEALDQARHRAAQKQEERR